MLPRTPHLEQLEPRNLLSFVPDFLGTGPEALFGDPLGEPALARSRHLRELSLLAEHAGRSGYEGTGNAGANLQQQVPPPPIANTPRPTSLLDAVVQALSDPGRGIRSTCSEPTNVQVQALPGTNRQLQVSWDPVADAQYYAVYRSTRAFDFGTEPVGFAAEGAFVDAGLTNQMTYFYQVRAVCSDEAFADSLQEFGVPRNLIDMPADWPHYNTQFKLEIYKASGMEPEDPHWMHLHRGHGGTEDSLSVGLTVRLWTVNQDGVPYLMTDPGQIGQHAPNYIRYTVRSEPVSPWLPMLSAQWNLHIDNPEMLAAGVPGGFSDISVEVYAPGGGPGFYQYEPMPAFLHKIRDGEPVSFEVPIINEIIQQDENFGPGVYYVDTRDRNTNPSGLPVDDPGHAFYAPPHQSDTYSFSLQPISRHGTTVQMLWQDPPHPGVPFIRGWAPEKGQNWRFDAMRECYSIYHECHAKFPIRDGGRGVSWMSAYVSGMYSDSGIYYFVETQGALRALLPNGDIVTIAGWRYTPEQLPIWPTKPLTTVRSFQQFVGNFLEGSGPGVPGYEGVWQGFHTPLDVVPDPRNENILYVAGTEDHVIWKVEILDRTGFDWQANISVFAGDPSHRAGFVDATGRAARFDGPASLAWKMGGNPNQDVLYVVDQNNDALRTVTRAGVVSTYLGSPGQRWRISARDPQAMIYNLPEYTNTAQVQNRSLANFENAAYGGRLEAFAPQTVRVDGAGRVYLSDIGFGSIRRIDSPTSAVNVINLWHKWNNDHDWGWAWFDTDRTGNSGGGIYFAMSNSRFPLDGSGDHRFNETFAWSAANQRNSPAWYVFPATELDQWFPRGWGRRDQMRTAHYPWVIAVDPRGGVLVGGFGQNGLSKLRGRLPTDPPVVSFFPEGYWAGRQAWAKGYAQDFWINPETPSRASRSLALKFGWDGRNHLGFASAWNLTGSESDYYLDQLFEIPQDIRQHPVFHRGVLDSLLKPARV